MNNIVICVFNVRVADTKGNSMLLHENYIFWYEKGQVRTIQSKVAKSKWIILFHITNA